MNELNMTSVSDSAEKIATILKAHRPTRERACAKCGLRRPTSGHDPCIANLPGVIFACCGHGVEQGYILFENGINVRGFFKIETLEPDDLAAAKAMKERAA
jgi:hypothetical protein